MSDDAPAGKPSEDSNIVEPAKTRAKKPGRWKRRLIITSVVLVVLAVVLRMSVGYILPPVLRSVAGAYGLDVKYERMQLYVLGGDVGISNIQFFPKEGGEPVIQAEYVRASISPLALLTGRIVAYRIEADGADLTIERDANGDIPLLKRILPASSGAPVAPAATNADLDLTPPLRIDALRVQQVRARLIDKAVTPMVDATVELNVRVSHVASDSKKTSYQIDVISQPLLDSMRIEGEGVSHALAIDTNFNLTIRGLHPKPAAGYLRPFGINPTADDINVRLTGTIKTDAVGTATMPAGGKQAKAIKAKISFAGISLRVDNVEAAAVDKVAITIDSLNLGHADIASIYVDGVRANANRDSAGLLGFAGLKLDPAAAGGTVAHAPTTQAVLASTQVEPFRFFLGNLTATNVRAHISDDAVTPSGAIAAAVESFSIQNITNQRSRTAPAALSLKMSSPGIADSVVVTGSATPMSDAPHAELDVKVGGIRPDALRTYLEPLGIESQLQSGTLTMRATGDLRLDDKGRPTGDVRLSDIAFGQGADTLTLAGVSITGAGYDSAANRVRLGNVEISGPVVSARREASGEIAAIGFRTKAIVTPSARGGMVAIQSPSPTTSPAIVTPPVDLAATLPSLELGKLVWKDVRVRLEDQTVSPVTTVDLADVGVELANILIDPRSTGAGQQGTIKAHVRSKDFVDSLTVDGTVTPAVGGIAVDLSVNGSGLNASAVGPYVKGTGVEPVLKQGTLAMRSKLTLKAEPDGASASLDVADFRYADGGEELASADSLKIDHVSLSKAGVQVSAVTLAKASALAIREADGALRVAGIRIPVAKAAVGDPAGVVAIPAAASTLPSTLPALPPFFAKLDQLNVRDTSLRWVDRTFAPAVDMTVVVGADVSAFTFGAPADPAKYSATVRGSAVFDELKVDGTLTPSLDAPHVTANILLRGLREGPALAYLPPALRTTMSGGQLKTSVEAGITQVAAGGVGATAVVNGFDFSDGSTQLLKFDFAKASISRLDIPAGVIAIDTLAIRGVETYANREKDGSIGGLGFAVGGDVSGGNRPIAIPPATQPVVVKAEPATGPVSDVASLVARGKRPMPLVTLETLDVNLKRVTLSDAMRPEAEAVVLRDVDVKNVGRIELLGDESPRPPATIVIAGGIDPMFASGKLNTQIFAAGAQTDVKLDLSITGIHGEGLTKVAPELKSQIDGTQMTDGTFGLKFESSVKMERRAMLDMDFSRGFGAEFSLKDVALRSAPDGRVLAGVSEVRADAIRVEPAKSTVVVKTLEVTKPILFVKRDASGVHLLGWVVKLPEASATTQATADAAPSAETVAQVNAPAPAPAQPAPSGEIRIEKLTVSGLDLRIEDEVLKPAVVLPLTDLDVEVKGLSSLALTRDMPIQFSAQVTSGKVKFPNVNTQQIEEHDLFSQVTASGKVSLYPQPRGWAKTSVSGFELAAVDGVAQALGLSLKGGTFDSAVDVRMDDPKTIFTRTRLIFTDLRLEDSPDGFLNKLLKLPAPLDVVIGAVQDTGGAITLPIDVPMEKGQISMGAAAGSAIGAVSGAVATGFASSPFKIAGGLGSMMGLGDKPTSGPVLPEIAFSPGDATLGYSEARAIAQMVTLLKTDVELEATLRHELGGGDATLLGLRANPTPQQCQEIAYQLREKKLELLRRRADVAAGVQGELASRAEAEVAPSLERLRDIDRDLAAIEDGMDYVYELTRPGAERQSARRTRAACIAVSQARLDGVKAALVASGLPKIAERIKITRPQIGEPSGTDGGRVLFSVVKVAKNDKDVAKEAESKK